MRRPYIAESVIQPGTAVVQGTADNQVKSGGSAGNFIGVYPFEANEAKAAGDRVGIALTGVEKVRAGATVTAGRKAVMDEDGFLVNAPAAPGQYVTCGTFLESGDVDEYIDMIVERGSFTIPAPPAQGGN
ncbi:hypothetical protein AGMMS50268_13380 [Spirochaetia bacterium]|nr:hypothetical protein AGMMS50268_13380 [Spirochaetia bacterium]